jgi:NitT/TauT family transport system substrate-binding protein
MKSFVLAAVAALAALSPATAQTKITGGVATFNEELLPIYAAIEKGYFKAAGIDLEMQNFKGGGPAAQAMVAGGVDLCFCAADHVMRLRARRQPTTAIVGLDDFHSYALVAKANAPYTDLRSLKGHKIGITSPGSLTDNTIRYSIKQLGLSPERDFEIVSAGTGATMRAALESGAVDAGMLVTTDAADALSKPGAFKAVLDYRTLPYPAFAALALVSWVESHKAAAAAFNGAVVHAMDDLRADPAFATAVLQKMYPTLPHDVVAESAKSEVARMPPGGVVSPEAVKNLNDIVLATDDSLKAVTPKEVYDPTLFGK